MGEQRKEPKQGKRLVFRAARRGPRGRRYAARDYGRAAWPIWIDTPEVQLELPFR